MSKEGDLHLDESQITGDDGEIHLFQWLCSAEKALRSLTPDLIKSSQTKLLATLVKVVCAADGFPLPGRPIRNVAGRCLVLVYQKGETKTLFDTLQIFLKIAGDVKLLQKDLAKVAALYCVGEIMSSLGTQVMSFMTEIALLAVKLAKASSNPILIRYHAFVMLRKSLSTAARACTENAMKDVLKQAKNALSDRSLSVQRAATEVLLILYPSNDAHRTVAEVESIVTLCVRSLDSADSPTRRALARLAGHILSSTQTLKAVPPPETGKKQAKGRDNDQDDEDISPPTNTSTETPKMIMTPEDMLHQLSAHFNKPASSRATRIGIFDFYASLFTALGSSFVENNYAIIVKHLADHIISYPFPRNFNTRYDELLVRHGVSVLLRDLIGVRMLSEQGQIGAARELGLGYLKKWPALMPGEKAPHKDVLVIFLREVAGLVGQMGNAPPPVQDALFDPLIKLLSHPSHSVRVTSAWALRCFCFSTPLRLPAFILSVMELLQRDIAHLANATTATLSSEVVPKALGHAYGLSALFAVIPSRPLYVSSDLSAKVLDLAISLLKKASEHDLKVADVEVEVAWTAISSLMTLGPNFVRAQLPQLMVLWRNALPKPTSKDTSAGTGRSGLEWMFLLHVRECALSAILAFLRHNSPALVTLDVARRLSSLLNNVLAFSNAFLAHQATLDVSEQQQAMQMMLSSSSHVPMTPTVREALLRRRVYQCFYALGYASLPETTQVALLQSAVTLFASPDGYAGSTMQAAIASSAGTFTSVWQAADGYGYGVTTLKALEEKAGLADESLPATLSSNRLNRDTIDDAIDSLIKRPVLASLEHDPLSICDLRYHTNLLDWPASNPASSAAVDSSIELFSSLLPLQDTATSLKIVSLLVDSARSAKLERNVGRKAAVIYNATVAILLTLRISMNMTGSQQRLARETLGNPQIASVLVDFLKDAIIHQDEHLRAVGSEAIGRLASLAGSNFLTNQVSQLVELVVNNREPNARAGCALTFGAIHSHVGGLAAGPLIKTTVNVLMSLSNDPHPLVHFWALNALNEVINAASLSYSPFISGTLGMLYKLYASEAHEAEGGTLINGNVRGDLPAYLVICRIIDAVMAVMGPELQDSHRTRTLILDLVQESALEPDEAICVEAIKCIQHFLMFAPDHVDIPDVVRQFRGHLSSSRRPLRVAAVDALYQLVQKDALTISKVGGDQLVQDLFRMLDDDSTIDGVRNVIASWLQQTVILNPSAWIDLCQRIMSRTTASQQVVDLSSKAGILQDEEGQALSADTDASSSNLMSRWRTQLFALQCLHSICTIVWQSGKRENFDLTYAKQHGIPFSSLLVTRVADLIKTAFTASAAYVTEIRLEGLVVLRDIIEVFAASPDPDYPEALLLEQHQAPITAALTPAFSSDSTPEILASAIQVCAVFVGSGVVKDVSRMGRILRLLTSALEQCKQSGMLSIGDAPELSPNASVMLRIATVTAWAELEISSSQQSYLKDVVGPYRSSLSFLWMSSLRDCASIRGDSEMLQDTSNSATDAAYVGLGRDVLLPYYEKAWLRILLAVSNVMADGEPTILAAMEGHESIESGSTVKPRTDRAEPTALFFVLFGLVYESLAHTSADATSTSTSRENAIIALSLLKSLVRPEYSGKALLEPAIFEEFTSLCYRMAMTETASVHAHLVEVVSAFARTQTNDQNKLLMNGNAKGGLPDQSPITHCLRICAFILRQSIPNPRTPLLQTEGNRLPDRIAVIKGGFAAFSAIGQCLGPSYREEVRAVSVALYTEILKDESSDMDLAGPTLLSLKAILDVPPDAEHLSNESSKFSRLVHGLFSACLLQIDEMRGRQGIISYNKVKNNLLAGVLILTIAPPKFPFSQEAVEYFCALVSQKLRENGEISLTAAYCVKTLLLASSAPGNNPALRIVPAHIVPGIISFLASSATASFDNHSLLPSLEEVLRAFVTYFAAIPEAYRARFLGVALPTLIFLVSSPSGPTRQSGGDATSPMERLHGVVVNHLVSLATTAPQPFKEATGKLETEQKEVLENAIREAIGGSSGGKATKDTKPTIALRSF